MASEFHRIASLRHAVDRGAQGFDRRFGLAQIALHAAQIVVAQRRIRAGVDIKLEHPRRAFGQFQIPGGEAQIDQQLRIFGIELEGAFIGHQRLVQMAHPLQRHGQHMKGLGIGVVDLGRLQRPLAGAHDLAPAPGADAALQAAGWICGGRFRAAASSVSCSSLSSASILASTPLNDSMLFRAAAVAIVQCLSAGKSAAIKAAYV